MCRPRPRRSYGCLLAAVAAALLSSGCGAGTATRTVEPSPGAARSAGPTSSPSPSSLVTTPALPTPATPAPATTAPATTAPATTAPTVRPTSTSAGRQGVDVSHHQGRIDWVRVRGAGMGFAYLKASEGRGFRDPAFERNWAGARAAGLRTGGYHYYSLCSPPQAQAAHFVAVLGAVPQRDSLPPVVDLELIGNCDPPPARATMLASVRAFIDAVESATGRRMVVYFHPDFERRYRMVEELERRLWVRRVGSQPPVGEWWMWQRSDTARVPGIATRADVNLLH